MFSKNGITNFQRGAGVRAGLFSYGQFSFDVLSKAYLLFFKFYSHTVRLGWASPFSYCHLSLDALFENRPNVFKNLFSYVSAGPGPLSWGRGWPTFIWSFLI